MENKTNPWRVSLKETPPNEMEKYSLYNEYISMQKQGFLEVISLVSEMIEQLKLDGEITENVKINARIKSAESALRNDDIEGKTLDDVFGVEIVAGNEKSLEKIMQLIEQYMSVTKNNLVDKSNGYHAVHKIMEVKPKTCKKFKLNNGNNDTIPLIEFQYKTFAVKENAMFGPANHLGYKGINTKEEIQEMYNKNQFTEFNLPIMYTVENGKIRTLNKYETIRQVYPFLKIRPIDRGEER